MQEWESITAAVAAAMAVLLLAGFLVCFICCCTNDRNPNPGVSRHRRVINNNNGNSNTNSKVCNRRVQSQYSFSGEAFSWGNHPSLVAEALEHGWTTFAFTHNYFNTNKKNSSSARPWGLCAGAGGDPLDEQAEPEITWEAVSASNLMQKIRLNPGSASSKFTALQTALPLPGPPLDGFPPESYLEIAIVSETRTDDDAAASTGLISDEDDRVKLLQLVNLDHTIANGSGNAAEGPRLSDITGKHSTKKKTIIALGQSASGTFGRALPGLDSGSVGFYSSGSVILNGMPVVAPGGFYSTILTNEDQEDHIEEELRSWEAGVGSVIGCGFDPATRCAYLTLNGTRVRSVQCRSQEFGGPLYPTIAANYDVTVLVNFGQRDFCYPAANSSRLSDPSRLNLCCLEDSQEFFSMDRIDPLWLADKAVWPAKNTGEADDGDLFDIVLDGDE